MNTPLNNRFNTVSGSSSYFDFVDEKAELSRAASQTRTTTTESVVAGTDAFVVQVMDEETSRALKQQYFSGYAFPRAR